MLYCLDNGYTDESKTRLFSTETSKGRLNNKIFKIYTFFKLALTPLPLHPP